MPQDPNAPQNPNENSKPEKGIDLEKILLPKKDPEPGKTLDSAERVNAAELLAQEQSATLPRKEETPQAPPQPPAPKEESIVKPIETYQGDIERLVQKKNVSVVSIAAAEASRRAAVLPTPPPEAPSGKRSGSLARFAMVMGGIFFISVTIGIVSLLYMRSQPVPLQTTISSPFIIVDGTEVVALRPNELSRPILMEELAYAKEDSGLPLGLVGRIFVAEISATQDGEAYRPLTAEELISTLSVNAPSELLRTLADEYLLGVHSFDDNQSFLVIRADSYTQAYAGMLAWERFMQSDLAPLFTRTPRPRTPEETSTLPTSTSQQLLPTPFVDAIVENHDARVVQDAFGDILLLWTFLDRNTIVVTTNEYTLREILTRFASSPNTVE